MTYETKMTWESTYERCSANQHGSRYKRMPDHKVKMVRMSTDCSSSEDMKRLIVLSNQLNVPLDYDFDKGIVALTLRAG